MIDGMLDMLDAQVDDMEETDPIAEAFGSNLGDIRDDAAMQHEWRVHGRFRTEYI
ncbi:hypothetical protein [Rhodovibrio sodomensis]|uniref:hypothetical protein n=1 Tax=Rhodovibrio sodomensis TaxID=1088 RepID=UPI001906FE0A|nr:hypothetical protein [Rhodovibrio sodomensis]